MWQVGSFNIKIIKDLNTKCTSVEYYLWVLVEKKTLLYSFSIFPDLPTPISFIYILKFYLFIFLNIEIPICGELLHGSGGTCTSAFSLTGTAVNEPGEKMWVAS